MTRLRAPKGMFRVVGVDLFDHSDYLVKDCQDKNEAFQIADSTNKVREGTMDDVYYVYDETGRYIRGNEDVGQKISP